jgi:hypothetical protein
MRPFYFTLHIKFTYHLALKTNDFNFPMIQPDGKIIDVRQIFLTFSFIVEYGMCRNKKPYFRGTYWQKIYWIQLMRSLE